MPGPYSAGTIFLEVVPSYKGFMRSLQRQAREANRVIAEELGKGAEQGGRDAGRRAGEALGLETRNAADKAGKEGGARYAGAFQSAMRRGIENVQHELSAIKIDADNDPALRKLREVKIRMEQLKRAKIGIDIDAGDALAELTELEALVTVMQANAVDIEVRTNAGAALAQFAAVRAQVERLEHTEIDIPVRVDQQLGLFERTIRQRIEAALSHIPPVEIDADTTLAQTEIAEIRALLFRLHDAKIDVDVDAGSALAAIESIEIRLAEIQNSATDIKVRADTGAAVGELAALAAFARKAAEDITINVDVDSGAAIAELGATGAAAKRAGGHGDVAANSFRAFNGVLLGAVTLGPLLIPVLAALAAGLAALGTAAIGAGAGLGVLVLGFSGISDAVKAYAEVDKNRAKDSLASAKATRTASNGLRDARSALDEANESAAQSAQDSARRVTDAVTAEADARRTAARAATAANKSVQDSERALRDATGDAARANREAAERTKEGYDDLKAARRAASKANVLAARNEKDAEDDLTRTRDQATKANTRALQARSDAERAYARTVEQTTDNVARAEHQQAQAEATVAETQRNSERAQRALTQARQDAEDQLEDLALANREGALSQREATLALADAQKEYDRVFGRDFASDRAKEDATLGLQQAQLQLDRITLSNARLADQTTRATAAGVDGAQEVVDANQGVLDAAKAVTDAQTDATNATTEAARARRDATVETTDAYRTWQEAIQAVTDTEADGARSVMLAERELEDAQAARRDTELAGDKAVEDARTTYRHAREAARRADIEGTERVNKAERDLADAQTARAQTLADNQRTIARAMQGVADAQRDQARAADSSAEAIAGARQRVTDAEQTYQDALFKTGEIGSSSQAKLEQALGKLSPAGQRFALFIFNLRDEFQKLRALAQEGLLPGVQEAMEGLINRYGPGLATFVGTMAKTLGDGFRAVGGILQQPVWADFFGMVARFAPLFTEQFGKILINTLSGFAGIATAFSPAAVDLGNALVGISEGFARWGENLKNSDSFSSFLDYVYRVGPKVWDFLVNIGKALVNIGVGLAPYAEGLLDALSGLFGFVADMDPKLLGNITFALLGLIGAFQLGTLALNTFTAAGLLFQATNPVGWIVAAIAGAAVAFALLYKNSKTFRTIVGGAFEFVSNIIGAIPVAVLISLGVAIAGLTVLTNAGAIAYALYGGWVRIVTGLQKAWTIAVAATNAVMDANPIGLVVVAIAALVAGLIYAYTHSDRFRAIVDGLWDAIVSGISKLEPVWTFVKWLFEQIVEKATWLYDVLVGHSVIPDLVNAVIWWFEYLIKPVLNAFQKVTGGIHDAAVWVKDFLANHWPLLLAILTGPIGLAVYAITTHWDSIKAVFTGATAWVKDTWRVGWNRVETYLIDPIKSAVTYLTGKEGLLADVKSLFNGIVDWVKDTWKASWSLVETYITQPITDAVTAIKTALGGITDGAASGLVGVFSRVVSAVGTVWDGLRDVAKKPINFIVETVMNKGLIGGFNKVAKFFKAPEIDDIPWPPKGWNDIPGKAAGGLISGPWRGPKADNMLASVGGKGLLRVNPKEYVQPVASVDHYGVNVMEAIRARAIPREALQNLAGLADGGLVWPAPRGTVGLGYGNTYKGGGYHSGQDFPMPINSPILAALDGVVKQVQYLTDSYGRNVLLGHANGAETLYAHMNQPLVEAGQIIKAGQLIGLSGSTGHTTGPHLHFEYRTPPGGYSHAINPLPLLTGAEHISAAGGGEGFLGSIMPDFLNGLNPADWLKKRAEDALSKVGDSPFAQFTKGLPMSLLELLIKKAKNFGTDALDTGKGIVSGLAGKIGLADGGLVPTLYDQGGTLPPGLSLVANATRRPEAVLDPHQLGNLEAIANQGGRQAPVVSMRDVYTQDPDTFFRKLEQRQNDAAAMYALSSIAQGV